MPRFFSSDEFLFIVRIDILLWSDSSSDWNLSQSWIAFDCTWALVRPSLQSSSLLCLLTSVVMGYPGETVLKGSVCENLFGIELPVHWYHPSCFLITLYGRVHEKSRGKHTRKLNGWYCVKGRMWNCYLDGFWMVWYNGNVGLLIGSLFFVRGGRTGTAVSLFMGADQRRYAHRSPCVKNVDAV